MSDQEARNYPESFVGDEEVKEALDKNVGEGTPRTAPHTLPEASLLERLRDVFVRARG